jgi:hypothetical protein
LAVAIIASILRDQEHLRSALPLFTEVPGSMDFSEVRQEYDGNRVHECQIVDFEGGKIKRVRAYFGEPFEAPQWRAQWVERM